MRDPVLETAIKEFNRHHGDVKKTPSYKAMQQWAVVIIDRGGKVPVDALNPKSKPQESERQTLPSEGKKARIRRLCREYIDRNETAPLTELYDSIIAEGESLEKRRLSAYLSEAKDTFVSDGKNWMLKGAK